MTAPSGSGHYIVTVTAGSWSLRMADYVLGGVPSCVADVHLSPPTRDSDVLADFVRRNDQGIPTLVMHRVGTVALHALARHSGLDDSLA